jgi:hypothetical protein
MNTDKYQAVIAKKQPLLKKIDELREIVRLKKPLGIESFFESEADLTEYDQQEAEILPEELEIDSIVADLNEITRQTFNNPYWDGYIEPGITASVFIDGKCLWTLRGEKLNVPPFKVEGDDRKELRQVKLGLDRPITKQRLIDIAERFGATWEMEAKTFRCYAIGTRDEVMPQDDEAHSTYHEEVRWCIRKEGKDWELLFSPGSGPDWVLENGENMDKYL